MNRKNCEKELSSDLIENSQELMVDFEKLKKVATAGEPVVPVAVQDVKTKEILIIAYANEKALRYTLENRQAAFWSTSRNELWVKGKTSGDVLTIVEVRINCEQNSLVYIVEMLGKGSCHVKNEKGDTRFGCYYRRIAGDSLEFVQ